MRFTQIPPENSNLFGKGARYCARAFSLLALLGFTAVGYAIDCSTPFASLHPVTDDVPQITATIEEATSQTSNNIDYCRVKVHVPPQPANSSVSQGINIWVSLPTKEKWNGRMQSEGGSVYGGASTPPTSMSSGYVGITTDTGHSGFFLSGSFGMLPSGGGPNIPVQIDFAYRSVHLMSVIGKQLIQAFYGTSPSRSYFNGCSTGGRQGLAMAQRYPEDYDGILAGAPAINFDVFQAAMLWPPMVSLLENGGAVPKARLDLATSKAVAACDDQDGVVDGVLTDPRGCTYDAQKLVSKTCKANSTDCLTATEANAINKIWYGSTNEKGNKRLWYGEVRGTDLSALTLSPAGALNPFPVATQQPKYWVYFDPNWDWKTELDYSNFESYIDDTITQMAPGGTATDNPDLSAFRDRGGKLILWHGFADQLIMPEGTIDYYDEVVNTLGGGYTHTQEFARLFMAPGVGHCGDTGTNTGPVPQDPFSYVVNWVENGVAPETILAAKKTTSGVVTQTRPLCPYPDVAVYTGKDSTGINDSANFECKRGKDNYPHDKPIK
ncbi:tannase/feruloyl esterase family alpha/beta hydrolase [Methylosarcina fibrata]|uniref:tannase/feruloyl esterase family alpha/beta hydrolase n=1 Tax=Methylosarcina fibrata TaxID=105972 RepID=UPI0009FBCA4B|nr:tannase/feruloyl esterase family alpha/beta hydrolase [Methylosarcina fibrata]